MANAHAATPESSHVAPSTYAWIWVWLAVLMLLGVLVAERLHFSKMTTVLVIAALSTIKALLVASYYMHLKFDRAWLTVVAVFPLVLVGLATLLVFSSRLVRL